jgi:hypothetical protein
MVSAAHTKPTSSRPTATTALCGALAARQQREELEGLLRRLA